MAHFEKYKVISKTVVGDTITFGVAPMVVPDNPVEDICFRDYLPGGCASLTGVENPVDDTAVIYACSTDWNEAKRTIKKNTHYVRYRSSAGATSSIENINEVSWGTI